MLRPSLVEIAWLRRALRHEPAVRRYRSAALAARGGVKSRFERIGADEAQHLERLQARQHALDH